MGSGLVTDNNQFRNATSQGLLWTANKAVLYPFQVSLPTFVRKFWFVVGTVAAGNVDMGIYTTDGVRLVSTGTTAATVTAGVQIITLGSAYRLNPGTYMLGFACDSALCDIVGLADNSASALELVGLGWVQAASSFVLPATMTFANYSEVNIYMFGLSTQTVM